MSFKDINSKISVEYRTLHDDVVNDFYIPCLSKAKKYYRAVAYFSSSILLNLTEGLVNFAKNGGVMKLLISPQLDEKDYDAIKNGYSLRDVLSNKIINSFDEFVDFKDREDRFGLLSYMIANNILEIKVVILEKNNERALYHEKTGIMLDEYDNIICFSGSPNETLNAFKFNYEDIDVYCSWRNEDNLERCNLKKARFDAIWNDCERGVISIPFPEVIKNKILNYKFTDKTFLLDENFTKNYLEKKERERRIKVPNLNLDSVLRKYQLDAIENWKKHNYIGIFDMATGTGKTFTAAGAITKLYQDKKRVLVIVCCPFSHLVEQWYEELKTFNIEAIKCYGAYTKYSKNLEREVWKFKRKLTNFLCIVTTNATFMNEHIKEIYINNLSEIFLIADEAHNFGATNISKMLDYECKYRLALSATIERKGDTVGNSKIVSFFGEKCIIYTLEQAIIDGFLTKYYYYPILVTFSEDELEEYLNLTKRISKYAAYADFEDNQTYKMLLIKRSRLIARTEDKINKLYELILKYKDSQNILIYCGAIKYGKENIESASNEELKQIKRIVRDLNEKFDFKATEFTSEENTAQRLDIINAFTNGDIQALVAIKCLDEGLNIPAIRTAFILASSTNPKEYIQRRGRVLRKYEGKKYAEIYDFITLPYSLDRATITPYIEKKHIYGLIRREFERLNDFSKTAINSSDSNEIINKIEEAFELNKIKMECDDYEL